jgi:putative flippase GtrA
VAQIHSTPDRPRPASSDAGARPSISTRTTVAWLKAFATSPGRLTEFIRYGGASAISLAFDTSVFMAILYLDLMTPAFAGAAAYTSGLLLSYAISVRYIFNASKTGKSNRRLITEYVASGLLGVALTFALIGMLTSIFALPPLLAKLITVAIVFVTIYIVRSASVFAPRTAREANQTG